MQPPSTPFVKHVSSQESIARSFPLTVNTFSVPVRTPKTIVIAKKATRATTKPATQQFRLLIAQKSVGISLQNTVTNYFCSYSRVLHIKKITAGTTAAQRNTKNQRMSRDCVWSIYLHGSDNPLPSFSIDENGVEKQYFIVPQSPTLLRYRVSVSHAIKQKIGALLTIDGKIDNRICISADGKVSNDALAGDFLAFMPVAPINGDTDQDFSQAAKTLGTVQIDAFEWQESARYNDTSLADLSNDSIEQKLTPESNSLPESKAAKMIGVNTVSGGKAPLPVRHPAERYIMTKIATLHGAYATAENFLLRQILPERYYSLLTASSAAAAAGAKRACDESSSVKQEQQGEGEGWQMPARKEKKARTASASKPVQTPAEQPFAAFTADSDGVYDLTRATKQAQATTTVK